MVQSCSDMPESTRLSASARRPPLSDPLASRAEAKSQPLTPGEVRSGSILHGQTALFHVEIPTTCQQLVVHLHKGSGDPLLMLRHGAPPRVPRRSRIIADFWDQEAFNSNGSDHHVAVDAQSGLLVPGTWYIGVTNYNYHVRETCRYALTLSLSKNHRAHASLGARVPFVPDPARDRMDSVSSRHELGSSGGYYSNSVCMHSEDGAAGFSPASFASSLGGARAQRQTPTRGRPPRTPAPASRPLDSGGSALRTPHSHGMYGGHARYSTDGGGGIALLDPQHYTPHTAMAGSGRGGDAGGGDAASVESKDFNGYGSHAGYDSGVRPAWADSTLPGSCSASRGTANGRQQQAGYGALSQQQAGGAMDSLGGSIGASNALSASMGVLADELARARSDLATASLHARGRALVALLGNSLQLSLAQALGTWAAAHEARGSRARRLERAGDPRAPAALLEAAERNLADARAQAVFAQDHAGRLSAALEREKEARAADAAAEFELLAALLRARPEYEEYLRAAQAEMLQTAGALPAEFGGRAAGARGGGGDRGGADGGAASATSMSGLVRLYAALGGDDGVRQLAELKKERWRLGEDERLLRQANLLHTEMGKARKAGAARGRSTCPLRAFLRARAPSPPPLGELLTLSGCAAPSHRLRSVTWRLRCAQPVPSFRRRRRRIPPAARARTLTPCPAHFPSPPLRAAPAPRRRDKGARGCGGRASEHCRAAARGPALRAAAHRQPAGAQR